jgi:HK97 family phage major capsid protein
MDTNQITEVKAAIDAQGRAWAAFVEKQELVNAELKARGAADPLLTEQVEKINKELDAIADRSARIETALSRGFGPMSGAVEDKAAGWSAERKDYDKWLRSGTASQTLRPISDDPAARLSLKSLSLGNEQSAGFLAPPEFAREIIKAETEFSPIRAVARVRETSMRSLQMPKRTGQFTAGWIAEQGTRTETQGLAFGLEEVAAHEAYALVDVSEQMMEDSAFDMFGELTQEFSEQFAVLEGASFVSGNGSGKPEGLLANTAIASVDSGSAATVADATGQGDGIVDMYHALKTAYAVRSTWLLNRATLGQIRKLKTSTTDQYIWEPGLAAGNPNSILGTPYVEVPDMPSQGADAFPLMLGDWKRAYLIADRIVMSILRDPYSQATVGNVRFIARKRVGAQVILAEAAIKLKCST